MLRASMSRKGLFWVRFTPKFCGLTGFNTTCFKIHSVLPAGEYPAWELERNTMKTFNLALCLFVTLAAPIGAAPLEEDAQYNSDWRPSYAQQLANEASALIRRSGYRCNSVSTIRSWLTKPGFTVLCNQYRYKYEIEDRGGRWKVSLK